MRAMPRPGRRPPEGSDVERGEWRAEASGDGETAGFWLDGLYSPWTTWAALARFPPRPQIAGADADVHQHRSGRDVPAGGPMRPTPASCWGDVTLSAGFMLPEGVVLITLGADLQADRIEVEIVGWGRDEESWSLAYIVLPGDPAQRDLWDGFDQVFSMSFEHPCGQELELSAACVELRISPIDRAAVLQRPMRRKALPKLYLPDQRAPRVSVRSGRGCTAKRKIIARCGYRRGRRQGSALCATQRLRGPGRGIATSRSSTNTIWILRAAHGRDVPGAVQQGFRASRVDEEGRRPERSVDARCYAYAALHIADRRVGSG